MIGNKKEIINWLLEQQDEKEYEIKEYSKKRTLNQNSYYWELLNKLATLMKVDKMKLHRDMLKHYSQVSEILIPSEYNITGYIEYFEKKSKIIKGDKEFICYRIYKPSHELNTKEMAALLDGLIEECKNVGIETIAPQRLAEMRLLENAK